MAAGEVAIGVIFLSQVVFGILGNSFLAYHYLLVYIMGYRLRFTDWILQHLVVANFLTLICKGVPETIADFGLKDFLDDLGCKFLPYLHRVGRGVSISSTSFVGVFQAITINTKCSRWTKDKVKSPCFIASCVYMSWILSLIANIGIPMNMTARWSQRNMTNLKEYGYCAAVYVDKTSDILYVALLSSPDVFFMGLMLWSSVSMVYILYRHRQRMKHIQRSHLSLRSSPETRATKTILLLVSTFVCFYAVSCLLHASLTLMNDPGWLLVNMATIVSGCFPTVSPFLLMIHDSHENPFCFAPARNRKQ
ncbi:vomeronasal type-1 receptor 4 [Cricetulus griseus]|uniref:Vomeronasal type-1 receptor n=2 Tax=Cricetulus griseus TaxID=10029 RepID=G3I330_CRIGR|nr:vomeronasal type-1 receptor 4 [Cricetulus griseus]EGW07708.1 Vomeronasal type-1 receptor 4 [Cricetulus griseus]